MAETDATASGAPQPPLAGSVATFAFVAGVCAALLVLALAAGPHSCEWGLSVYFWAGIAAVLVLAALPLLPWFGHRPGRAALHCVQHVALACAAWLAGIFIGDFQIMCRLF